MDEIKIKRDRSEFWVNVYSLDDGGVSIITSPKFQYLFQNKFAQLEALSPTKWKDTKTGSNKSLWIPSDWLDEQTLEQFIEWAKKANNHLWLGVNKNICNYFSNQLDYCIASDWNFTDFTSHIRSNVGEAEYMVKYQYADGLITLEQAKAYGKALSIEVEKCIEYLPITNIGELLITTIPAVKENQNKLSWNMARYIHNQIGGSFLAPMLLIDKPQMKELTIEQKINTWKSIYASCNNISLSCSVSGKDIIIVDDLYQSGATIWAYANYLKKQGARMVMGLTAVKSLRDSDNK